MNKALDFHEYIDVLYINTHQKCKAVVNKNKDQHKDSEVRQELYLTKQIRKKAQQDVGLFYFVLSF